MHIEAINWLNVGFRICIEKAEQYIQTLNNDIDTAAEVDNGYFWKRVKRRKSGQSSGDSQIKFGDTTCRSPDEICRKWVDFSPSFILRTILMHMIMRTI